MLGAFFADIISRAIVPKQEDLSPIVQVYINHEKCFAFVELKSIELTTACLGLDGIKYPHRNGSNVLRVRRPNDFKPELVPSNLQSIPLLNLSLLGIVATTVSDGPGKVFVGGLPYHLTDDNVKELLSAFGPLKSFHLVRDPNMTTSKGYGFCEYYDETITRTAIEGLNGMQIGEKTLTVRIATQVNSSQPSGASNLGLGYGSIGFGNLNPIPSHTGSFGGGAGLDFAHLQPTRVRTLFCDTFTIKPQPLHWLSRF